MVVPAVAVGGFAGANLLRQLVFQAGLTGLSAAAMDPNAGKKLGKVGGFAKDLGGHFIRDVLGTQPTNRQAPQMFGPAYGNVSVPSGGQRNFGPGYKNKELAAGQAAENFRTGAGFPGQSPAAERAYQAERSSVAQQAAQNPELQRYQDQAILARQALQGYDPASGPLPGAAQTAQDMGMAMWATANPKLAAKIRPGQSGFGAIQNTLAGSAANTGFQLPSQLLTTPPPPVTPTPFPTAIPQSGFQVPGAPTADQLSSYPQFDPTKLDIGPFAKFMQANRKK
jgi:hypothetical protein